MKFRVYSTYWDNENWIDKLIESYPYLKNLHSEKEVVEREWVYGTRKETVLTIEVESLEQLMNLKANVEYELIIGSADEYKLPYIEIYDGYRE